MSPYLGKLNVDPTIGGVHPNTNISIWFIEHLLAIYSSKKTVTVI